MISTVIRHTVKDFDTWKPYFDDNADLRREGGSQGYRLFKSETDSNDVLIVFDWDTAENAKAFFDDPALKDLMKEAGVIGRPDIEYMHEVEASMPEKPLA